MFNDRIKELRLANNFSQVDMANRLSVSKQAVSNWENDNIQPSIEMLIKIADLFGVSIDYLLGREDIPRIDVRGLSPQNIQHINAIVNDIRKLNK
jgi:transcriptional regulator with XRE-family HTH domain